MDKKTALTSKYLEILNDNIQAIRSATSAVRGTIGAKGLDVMLVDEFGNFTCTNDGVEILSNIQLNHPTAKFIVEAAKSQESAVGDGATTTAILTDSLLASALLRINSGARPSRLAKGINVGIDAVINVLNKVARPIENVSDPKLQAITNISARGQDKISTLIIEAAKRTIENNSSDNYLLDSNINYQLSDSIIASSGLESSVIDGLFIKKRTHFNYAQSFENAHTLVIEGPFEPEPMSSEAVSTDEGVRKFEHNIQSLLETAKKIAKSGVKAIFTSSSMLPTAEEFFVKEGIFVLTHISKSNINNLINISGAKLATRTKLTNSDVDCIKNFTGELTKIEYSNDLSGFIFQGAKNYQASILISAETETLLEERKLIAIDAAKALTAALRSGFVIGGGIEEMNIADSIEQIRTQYEQDKDISAGIETVVESLKAIFHQITENAGFNHNEIYYKFRPEPGNTQGISLDNGEAKDFLEAGILDPLEVKTSAFRIAGEIATQILRINMVVQSK